MSEQAPPAEAGIARDKLLRAIDKLRRGGLFWSSLETRWQATHCKSQSSVPSRTQRSVFHFKDHNVNVIDLGLPLDLRRELQEENHPQSPQYRPNPRLFPGAKAKRGNRKNTHSNLTLSTPARRASSQQPSVWPSRASQGRQDAAKAKPPRPHPKRGSRHPRQRIAAVSTRLYQPPQRPVKPPPAPLVPATPWAPPPAVAPPYTASDVALHLADLASRGSHGSEAEITSGTDSRASLVGTSRRKVSAAPAAATEKRVPVQLERLEPSQWSEEVQGASRLRPRLAVTLPTGPPPAPSVYFPKSQHFRERSQDSSLLTPAWCRKMATTSLEDSSDGNDSLSVPSEFLLAEFLSAIMRRKYPAALRYCRLILQSEPQNATARSFYPLLVQKAGAARSDLSSDASATPSNASAYGSESASYESLSLDLSEHSSRSPSASFSLEPSPSPSPTRTPAPATHRLIPMLSLDDESPTMCHERWQRVCVASSSSSAEWGQHPDCSASPDDNGNPAILSLNTDDEDAENENASGDHTDLLKDPELQALRAQFACSIK